MIKVNFEARDYGYTIISRFERLLRIICHETLISKSHDFQIIK